MPPQSADSSRASVSLADRTATGVIWGAGGALVYQLFALFVQTALTYLLTKAQYGAYGKAFAMLGLAMLVQQVGFNEILLRRQARLRLWASVAFWFALALGLLGSVALLALARPLGLLYGDPELTTLILLMCPTPLLRSLLVLPSAQLVEAMRFRLHYGLMLVNALVTSSATLAFAAFGLGAKSFVAGTLLADPLYIAVMWRLAGSEVRWGPRPSRWLPLARDLRFVFGSNVARWVRTSVDPLIFGLFAPASAVGVYFFAQSMVGQIVRVVTLNLSGVLLPALNQIARDPQRQTAAFLRAARVLTLIGAPLCVGLGASGSLFVRVFLDARKWDTLPPVLAVLALGMVFRLADEPVQSLISAQGRFRLGFRVALGTGLLYVIVCSIGSIPGSPLSVAAAAACYYAVMGPLVLYQAIRVGGGRFSEALCVFWVPFVVAVAAIAPWLLLDRWMPGHGRVRDAAVLAALIAGSSGSYLWLGRILQPAGWRELLDQAHNRVPSRFKRLVARIGGTPSLTGYERPPIDQSAA
jgi:O-antigen/teichoic acid export membrane protein